MATNEESDNQKNLNREINKTNNLDSQNNQYAQTAAKAAQARVDFARSLTEELKDQLNIRSKNNETDRAQLSLSRQVAASAAENNVLLGNSQQISRQILKDEKLLSDIVREKQSLVSSIGGENSKGYEIAQKVATIQRRQFSNLEKIDDLQLRILGSKGEEKKVLEQQLKNSKTYSKSLDTQLNNKLNEAEATGVLGKKEIDRLAVLSAMEENQLDTLRGRRKEADIQSQINDKMGVTGALVEGVGGIMQRLGMRSGIFAEAMSSAQEEMFKLAESGVRTKKVFNETTGEIEEVTVKVSKAQTMLAGLTEIAKGFGKALFDPATAIAAILDAFFDVNKAATETVHLTGQNAVYTQGLNTRLATTVQFLETTAELTKQTGMNAQNIFTPDVIAGAAELKNTMGLAANEAGGLATIAQTTTGDIDAVTNAIVDTTSQFNKANRSAISQGQILRDVATAGEGVKASLSGNPKLLAQAASAARRLGMELSQLDSIASSLLNFESSIEAELEAQLLTGKQMNLAKARELALNNDLAGVGKEIFKNSASIAEFGKMNRIQQEAQAKALGLTRDQLGKIAYQRALEAGMTDEQAAKAAGVNAEEMKRMAVQEKIQMLMGKLAQSFAPILEALVPIVDTFTAIIAPIAGFIGYLAQGLAAIIKFPPVLFAIKAALIGIAAVKAFNFAGEIASAAKNAGEYAKKLKILTAAKKGEAIIDKKSLGMTTAQIVVGKAKLAIDTVVNSVKETYNRLTKVSILQALKEKAAIIGSYIAEKASNIAKALGNGIRAISNGLQNISILNYIKEKGAIVLSTVATLANTVAQTAWNAVKNIQIGTMIRSAGLWIAEKARMIADTAARWLNVGATSAQTGARAAQAAVNTTLAGSQTAVAATSGGLAAGLTAAGTALGAFGVAAAPAIPILLAIGAALLMASPAIYALGKMVVGLATVIGGVLMKALEMIPSLIDAVAQGFVTMLGAITLDKIAALALMGPALISVAFGLGVLTSSIFTSLPAIGMLGAIALMGPGLMTAGNGIRAMAEGVAKLSEALASLETDKLEEIKDLISTTAIAAPAVAATGAITSLIQGISGGGGENQGNMDAKLDELIAAVRSGANVRVYLDSDDITKRTVIESTTLS